LSLVGNTEHNCEAKTFEVLSRSQKLLVLWASKTSEVVAFSLQTLSLKLGAIKELAARCKAFPLICKLRPKAAITLTFFLLSLQLRLMKATLAIGCVSYRRRIFEENNY